MNPSSSSTNLTLRPFRLSDADDEQVTRFLRWETLTTRDEALTFIKEVLTDFPKVVRLQAFTDVENIESQRVLEKAGFKMEGLLRKYTVVKGHVKDTLVYSFLSTDAI
ncbi:hypothetical protein L1987_19980 [Smallanthus sonchifolius]|uniref:Uncharacterized protein n=1 Tax=Smallanthus sonchifolius TaxID=185202 RepID=A0ACB9IQ53_9ASTR|nr:hypothetical protein L1987_19980 [Smallanthus sonchifolius]